MPGRPWFPFYSSDWRGDVNLRACSPTARAVWLEMILVMEAADPPGYLRVAGKPIGAVELAAQAAIPVAEVQNALGELQEKQVLSRLADGCVYSRRIVRREEVRIKRAAGGKESGKNPNVPVAKDTLKDTLEGYPSTTCSETPKDILEGPPQIPDTRYQIPEPRDQTSTAKTTPAVAPAPADADQPALVVTPKKSRETWLSDLGADWETACGGEPSYPKLGKYLSPLVKLHGAETVREHWRQYLAETEAHFASPARFAETFGNWGKDRKPRLTERQRSERSLLAWATREDDGGE